MWIYKANANGYPGTLTDFSSCSTNCIKYNWNTTTKTLRHRATRSVAAGRQHSSTRATQQLGQRRGVYVKLNHKYITKLFGASINLTDHAVFRLEPAPTQLCRVGRCTGSSVRAHEGNTKERGFFMVWFALTFVTLTAFAGLAIEYNRWENIGNRVQKAADAAALAGAVFMPENVGNKAYTTAKTIASQNGFTDGSNGIVITTAAGRLPNQLKVTISVPTKNPFGGIVGYGSTTIQRKAVAEYQLPQNLGSPQNIFGNDPESAATPAAVLGERLRAVVEQGQGRRDPDRRRPAARRASATPTTARAA